MCTFCLVHRCIVSICHFDRGGGYRGGCACVISWAYFDAICLELARMAANAVLVTLPLCMFLCSCVLLLIIWSGLAFCCVLVHAVGASLFFLDSVAIVFCVICLTPRDYIICSLLLSVGCKIRTHTVSVTMCCSWVQHRFNVKINTDDVT